MSSPTPLKTVLKTILLRYGYKTQLLEIEVKNYYYEIVGEMVTKHTKKVTLKNKTLTISIDSPVIKDEIMYIKDSLILKINEKFREDQDIINKIKIF